MNRLSRYLPDRFTLFLVTTVVLASLLPSHGVGLKIFNAVTMQFVNASENE